MPPNGLVLVWLQEPDVWCRLQGPRPAVPACSPCPSPPRSPLLNLSPLACRYRKYRVSEDVQLVVRCEVDGVMTHKGQDEFLSIKALNEYDPKITGEQGTWACWWAGTATPWRSQVLQCNPSTTGEWQAFRQCCHCAASEQPVSAARAMGLQELDTKHFGLNGLLLSLGRPWHFTASSRHTLADRQA